MFLYVPTDDNKSMNPKYVLHGQISNCLFFMQNDKVDYPIEYLIDPQEKSSKKIDHSKLWSQNDSKIEFTGLQGLAAALIMDIFGLKIYQKKRYSIDYKSL